MSTDEKKLLAWKAQEGPQTALLECKVEDIFYGGARGGGKTDGLLGDFLAHAGRYGKNARGILFRRTLEELADVIRRAREIYKALGWKYNETKHEFTAPNGATLRLRYLDVDADADNYQGHQYTWEGFDELGNWPDPAPIDKLWGCLRSAAGVPCVRRSTGNPGGPGHGWVRKRYIDHGPWKIVTWRPVEEKPELTITSVFIPSRLEDNPLLMQGDPQYEARLYVAGGPALARAWRFGDWDVLAGQYFDLFDVSQHVVRRGMYALEPWHTKWLSMDWGYNDQSVIHWHRIDEEKRVVTYRELATNGKTPDLLGKMIYDACPKNDAGELIEHYSAFYLSPDAFHKRSSERTIADELYDGAMRMIPRPTKADDDRVGGWQLMYQLLQSGHWKIDEFCAHLIDAIPLMVRDAKDPNDIAPSKFDHPPDSARYGLKTKLKSHSEPEIEKRIQQAAQIKDITSRHMALIALESKRTQHGVGVKVRRYYR